MLGFIARLLGMGECLDATHGLLSVHSDLCNLLFRAGGLYFSSQDSEFQTPHGIRHNRVSCPSDPLCVNQFTTPLIRCLQNGIRELCSLSLNFLSAQAGSPSRSQIVILKRRERANDQDVHLYGSQRTNAKMSLTSGSESLSGSGSAFAVACTRSPETKDRPR